MPKTGVNLLKTGVKLTLALNIDSRYEAAGSRLAGWLRDKYPRNAIKLAAADLGVSPNTVKKWLAGVMPEGKHVFMMAAKWGRDFMNHVFEPAIGADDMASRRRELQEMKARLERLEARDTMEINDGLMEALPSVGGGLRGPMAGIASPAAVLVAPRPGREMGRTYSGSEI